VTTWVPVLPPAVSTGAGELGAGDGTAGAGVVSGGGGAGSVVAVTPTSPAVSGVVSPAGMPPVGSKPPPPASAGSNNGLTELVVVPVALRRRSTTAISRPAATAARIKSCLRRWAV